jgi:hypothetical protein
MQLLESVGPLGALLIAIALGTAFGLSLSHQLALQRLASLSPKSKEAGVFQRISFAGLSMSLLAMAVIAGKYVSVVRYEVFILTSAISAVAVLLLRLRKK